MADYIMAIIARLTWTSIMSLVIAFVILFFIIGWKWIPNVFLYGIIVTAFVAVTGAIIGLLVPVGTTPLDEFPLFPIVCMVSSLLIMLTSANELDQARADLRRGAPVRRTGIGTMWVALGIQCSGVIYIFYAFWVYMKQWEGILYAG